ncbi:MAG: PQQ-binding-like beta-propeller repeat protein [Thermoplasmata archaeon]|nr:PQQ-binding-like beta-propeller repeat protein [Thermoplasmata archaeon]
MNGRRALPIVVVTALLVVVAGAASYLVYISSRSNGPGPVSSGMAVCPASPTNQTSGNWTTYHQDNSRAGVEAANSNVGAQPRWSVPTALDGQVYAEPLVCGNSVYVATENDSVYAINATSGTVLWHTSLGTPVPASALPCGDIDPTGITGTPVIDVAAGTLYAVAFLDSAHPQHVLFGLNVASGSVESQLVVDPAGSIPTAQQQRGALALANGHLYIPYGGLYGDCGQYHGWIVGAPLDGTGALISYQVPTQREGAIWGTAGMAVATNGTLYVATGNGASRTTFDYGDSVIELSPNLSEVSYFAPTNWAQLNADDTDLGSVAPTLLPNGEIFQIGKAGVGYLLSGSDLGGIGPGIYSASVCGGGAYGATAHVAFSILVPCTDGLYDLAATASNFSLTWHTSSFDAGSPIVTGGIVWVVDISNAHLLGFNLSTGQQVHSSALGSADHFISPAAAPGSLYVAGGSELYAYSLT